MVENYAGINGLDAAECRAGIYRILLRVFVLLPDSAFLNDLSGIVSSLPNVFKDKNNRVIDSGISLIESYIAGLSVKSADRVLNELAVDRTGIMRGAGSNKLKPPYESLYCGPENTAGVTLSVKNFYRRSGLLPDGGVTELPDYLGIELDFMYHLCLREIARREADESPDATVILERDFLKEHLGRWSGEFCTQAEPYARTDLYRGFLRFLPAFIETEKNYLSGLVSS